MKKDRDDFFFESEKKGLGMDRQNTVWMKEIARKCKHKWQPISFVFESQVLDKDGRVLIRQPDLVDAKVYCVCMKCLSHSYVKTGWINYYLGSPDLLEEEFGRKNGMLNDENELI